MSTDLDQQLPRFAEALDREAPAISVDEIVSRRTIVVDVDQMERPAWDQVPRLAAVSADDAMFGHAENGERDASIELAPTAAERPARRRVGLRIALAAAAAAVLVVALGVMVRTSDEPDPAVVPPSTVPTPPRRRRRSTSDGSTSASRGGSRPSSTTGWSRCSSACEVCGKPRGGRGRGRKASTAPPASGGSPSSGAWRRRPTWPRPRR